MCRNIKNLSNYEPPATKMEIRDAAIQFVRKISGATKPSKANEATYDQAVDEISATIDRLLLTLVTPNKKRNREQEAEKIKLRNALRYGRT